MNVQKYFGARFVFHAAQVVIDLVQARKKDKHKLSVERSRSLIIDVLDCLSHSSLNVKSVPTSEVHSLYKFSFGTKSIFYSLFRC
uniref:Uncharacterized protein n=1 Tax=Triticum urartu TaxID=4572 RepID=A0A8R7QCY1_TRIUA